MSAERRRGLIAAGAPAGVILAPALLLLALPPATLQPRQWALFPGWAYTADGLSVSLAALLLLLAGTALAQTALDTPTPSGRARQGAGWALLLLGLGQTVFAAGTGGRWLGLEVAGLALALLIPGTPRSTLLLRHLAGYPLLAVAFSGVLDAPHAPGAVIAALPAWVVIPLLLAILVRTATLLPHFAAPTLPPSATSALPSPIQKPKAKSQNPAVLLYAAATFYPLIRSLAAGPWDGWGRFAAVAVGLLLLAGATAYCVVRSAYPGRSPTHPAYLIPQTLYLVGAVVLGLGLGSAAGVSGALALGAVGLLGHALRAGATDLPGLDGTALRGLGRWSALGLPPFAGFAGLWLLAGALLPARTPLGLVLVLALPALLVGNAARRARKEAGTPAVLSPAPSAFPLLPLAGLLLLGGLAPAVWLDGLIQPAANSLAAGVPALTDVILVPGLGYAAGPDGPSLAAWPVLGLSVAVALAWLAVELGTRLGRSAARGPGSGGRDPLTVSSKPSKIQAVQNPKSKIQNRHDR